MSGLFDGIRLITIDLDDTVWPCAPVIQRAEETLFQWLAREAPRLAEVHDLQSLRVHRKTLAGVRPERAHDLTWLRREHLRLLLHEFGYDVALADTGISIFRQARNRVTPYPEVARVLARWRTRFTLVSVTNGNSDVEQTPLRGLFHHHLDAAQAGAAKPDPAIFHLALERTGVTPTEALHIGDDPARDIVPAQVLGMRTLWVNRSGADWPDSLEPADATAADLAELVR
jgi:putative hydrolase of the HAD superfamily